MRNGNGLPSIRENLRLLTASADEDGEPRWQLFDPLSNKFFYLSRSAFYIFCYWTQAETVEQLLQLVSTKGVEVSEEELGYFIRFLELNHLLSTASVRTLQHEAEQHKKNFVMWLLHNYLFIKVPLWRPDQTLNRVMPAIDRFFRLDLQRWAMLLGLIGLILVVRQWETFTHTFQNFLSIEGMLYYFLALVVVKTLHELGHAFVAKRHGCRVSSMGLAFLVMTPILYTDTTDAWRLKSRWQRLDIVTAGVRTELYIACVATFLWTIIPDGHLRSAVFFIATTSWLSSVLINISPFMRFDGYYALSDFLGVENLQPRSFLVGKWLLREKLFGLGMMPPEPLNRRKCFLMASYAWATWVYRFILFLGIALLVYHFAFKLLGIVLFAVEIIWFLAMPIFKELASWYRLRGFMSINLRSSITFGVLAVLLAFLVLPWRSHISAPAVMTSAQYLTVFSVEDGKLLKPLPLPNSQVTKGQLLAAIESDLLETQIQRTDSVIENLDRALRRATANVSDRAQTEEIASRLAREQAHLSSLLSQREQLLIRAPFDGFVGEIMELKIGDYISHKTPLLTLYDSHSVVVKAYLKAEDLPRLEENRNASFISDYGQKFGQRFVLDRIAPNAVSNLPYLSLASIYGGQVSVEQLNEQLVPQQALYEILLISSDPLVAINQQSNGEAILALRPESLIHRAFRHVYAVLIKESSF